MLNAKAKEGGRDVIINLRASRRQRTLIDRAANALGKNRSLFMLEAACAAAGDLLADRRFFLLDDRKYRLFAAALDRRPTKNPEFRRLLKSTPPWAE